MEHKETAGVVEADRYRWRDFATEKPDGGSSEKVLLGIDPPLHRHAWTISGYRPCVRLRAYDPRPAHETGIWLWWCPCGAEGHSLRPDLDAPTYEGLP